VLGDGTYGIHGTNRPKLIGTAVSYGCIRMRNSDILDLFSRVKIGTPVFVVR
jgi:lipoprotein-anchoring transpeptidase ErfK/SrfK